MSAEVRTFRQYLGDTGTSHYSDHLFCGSCDRLIASPYGFERTPEHLDERGSFPMGASGEFLYYAFCPWCGIAFDDEWWCEKLIENERVVDHYDHPGTHAGDTHEFRGSGLDCMVGHVLASSGHDLCWCNPTVEPGLLGCRIIHNEVAAPEARTSPTLSGAAGEGNESGSGAA